MSKILKAFIFFIILLGTYKTNAQDIVEPLSPPRLVNDYTSTLTLAQKRSLEERLLDLEKATSVQVAIIIIPTLNGYDISDYASRLGEKWGIGTKDNNGVVFITSLGEKKVFIATGYGIEDILPDAYAKRITSRFVVPQYKNGKIYEGINIGVENLRSIILENYKGSKLNNGQPVLQALGIPSIIFIIFIIIIVIIFKTTSNQFHHLTSSKNNHHTAGGEGKFLSWILLNSLLNRSRQNKDIWDNFNSGSGSFFGNSDNFGGFGGGKFGGGGAGDSW